MIFFGWGRNAKQLALSPQQMLLLRYTYLHVFWAFRISWPQGYSVASLTRRAGPRSRSPTSRPSSTGSPSV